MARATRARHERSKISLAGCTGMTSASMARSAKDCIFKHEDSEGKGASVRQVLLDEMKVPRRIVAIEIRLDTSQISRKINFSI